MSVRRGLCAAGTAARQLRAATQPVLTAQAASSSRLIPAQPDFLPRCQSRYLHPSLPTFKKASHAKGKAKSRQEVESTDNNPFDADGEAQLAKVRAKMDKALEWATGVVWEGVERGRGRVTPALLDSVKVSLPDGSTSPLNNIASVTVRNNALFVEVWDHDATKAVEAAIHRSNLPGLSPQKIDNATLKIPISRPTVEQRAEILKNLHTTVEGAKNQVRLARNEGMKAFGGRGEAGAEDVQKLADEFGGELDGLMSKAKKEFEKA